MIEHEAALRLIAFGVMLVAVALWESRAPRRVRAFTRRVRWPNNLGVVALNSLIVRAIFPLTAVAFALEGERRRWGLLNNLHLPEALKIIAAVTLLDLAIYLQHVMFHAAPALWRIHRMHHADLDFDVTTGVRFHPAEIVLSMTYKLGVIAALGASAASVFVFETLLNATSMFNHANLRMPARADSILRIFIVTPDMHRVHHSIAISETNSNFGFNLPWWDWMLGTYKAQPAAGHERMTIGIEQFREAGDLRLDRMLMQPLRGQAGGYAITRGDGE
jgi:sterol desaturase/sphingolipid hydroxylase (fatty acid hydroxylase superfamily)